MPKNIGITYPADAIQPTDEFLGSIRVGDPVNFCVKYAKNKDTQREVMSITSIEPVWFYMGDERVSRLGYNNSDYPIRFQWIEPAPEEVRAVSVKYAHAINNLLAQAKKRVCELSERPGFDRACIAELNEWLDLIDRLGPR